MKKFRLSPQAIEDIRDIWRYIADDNIEAAAKVRGNLLDACRLLAENPLVGRSRPEFTEEDVRFWPVGTYLIIYRASAPVDIVRVVHGARDLPSLFS